MPSNAVESSIREHLKVFHKTVASGLKRFINEDDSTNIEIELRDLKTILDDIVIGDYAEFHAEETHEDLFDGYAITIDRFISDRVLSKIAEFNQKAFLNSSAKKSYKPIEISEDGLELIEFLSVDCTSTDDEWHSEHEIKIDKNGFAIVDHDAFCQVLFSFYGQK